MLCHQVTLEIGFIALLGLAVGSFLNVLSLRTLADKSIWWPPSQCGHCQKTLPVYDNIPLISYLLLRGRCRHCKQGISWQYPLVEALTASMFIGFYIYFGATWYTLGMLIFGCTLISVCITDFREKLIPHDITYPAMLMGLFFSAVVRHDFVGAMVGVGASYILFDFLAHYGLKLYLRMHAPYSLTEVAGGLDDEIDSALAIDGDPDLTEEVEVLGGGDAVLAAVISAWLGWERLLVAVAIGFILGTVMGLVLLLKEMQKAQMLKECYQPALAGAILGFALLGLPLIILAAVSGVSVMQASWLGMAGCGAVAGCMVGVISVGSRVSKPFPFGPALAAGALVAIFWNPLGTLLSGGA